MKTIRSLLFSLTLLMACTPSLFASKLIELVSANKYKEVEEYLKTSKGKKEINTPGSWNSTPLLWACSGDWSCYYDNRLEIVKLLLKNGADPTTESLYRSPISFLCLDPVWRILEQKNQLPSQMFWIDLFRAKQKQHFREELLMSLVPFKKHKNETGKQTDSQFFIESVLTQFAEQMGNSTSAPEVQITDELCTSPDVKNQNEVIKRIEKFVKILLFESRYSYKPYIWRENQIEAVDKTQHQDFTCSLHEFRLNLNFSGYFSTPSQKQQDRFWRTLKQITNKTILAHKIPSKKNTYGKISDILIICHKPRNPKSIISFEKIINTYNAN